jgi:uncharacterized MAPEG superfamily protein
MWVPYVLDRMAVRGILRPSPIAGRRAADRSRYGQARDPRASECDREPRAVRAGILIAHELNISTPVTRAAAAAYFAARLLHFIVYTAGIPMMRTLMFSAGWRATVHPCQHSGLDVECRHERQRTPGPADLRRWRRPGCVDRHDVCPRRY